MTDGPILNDDDYDTKINPNEKDEKDEDDEVSIGGGAINEKKRTYHGVGNNDEDSNKKGIQQTTTIPISSSTSSTTTTTFRGGTTTNRAHLMHAIEGLHRYPNYMSRWQLDDINELENSLKETLSKVQNQKSQILKHRNDMQNFLKEQILSPSVCKSADEEDNENDIDIEWMKDFIQIPQSWNDIQQRNILHPKASKAIFQSKLFLGSKQLPPTFSDVLSGKLPIELDTSMLQQLMDEECYDCYSFPIFSNQFCKQLRDYIKYITIKQSQYNNNKGGTQQIKLTKDLDNLGLRWLNDLLLNLFVRPISKQLYKSTDLDGGDLDWRQGYIAAYSFEPSESKPRQRLVPHTDDSEVTLNICLGDENFEGGDLHLWGLRGSTSNNNQLSGEYEPEIGRALIHSGRQLHEVTPITFGDRYAYIVWTRSWNGIRSTTCPCCWLNNRRDHGRQQRRSMQQTNYNNNNNNIDSCICGSRWN